MKNREGQKWKLGSGDDKRERGARSMLD